MSVVLGGRECADAFRLIYVCFFFVSVVCGHGNAHMHSVCFLFCLFMSVVLGGRECADAFRLIYVCCFGGKGMRRCIPFDLCLLFWGEGNAQILSFLFMSVVLGGRECADAFRLISALSFYVCCFGGKGM